MPPELDAATKQLSPMQLRAVQWEQGAALVLVGPGVDKTTVLTTRIARILNESRKRRFRILALTFTTKAGDEMRHRVDAMAPGLSDRAVIGTFHSFCAQVLRLHGSHLKIKTNFSIYDQDNDRTEILRDALNSAASAGEPVASDDVRWLKVIDQLRRNLVGPENSARYFRDLRMGERVALVYSIYENALREHNAMDFNGLIMDTCRLAHRLPAIAARIRQSYPYWLIDEFQDTTPAQYRLVRSLAGSEFKNVFAVADDDQIIYQWAGASYRQIVSFRDEFSPVLMQLVENRRCPPQIVQAANNLIAYNSDRTPGKELLVSTLPNAGTAIVLREYRTDGEEANAVATEIADLAPSGWGQTVVLGRTRAILKPVLDALNDAGVNSSLPTRRDRFVSPQFIWLHSCLELSLRSMDRWKFTEMVGVANRIAGAELDAAVLAASAESANIGYLEHWALAAKDSDSDILVRLAEFALRLVQSRVNWRRVVSDALEWLPTTNVFHDGFVGDVEEDKAAWEFATSAIRIERGGSPDLDDLIQGFALRPKEPPPDPNAVRLLTIHAAKGLEFENVWLVGAAESILPSWQSLKDGANPADLEEERRNFFVAITRTRRRLTLTYANRYRGWHRQPSRFINEMNLHRADPVNRTLANRIHCASGEARSGLF